ncbi:MarR family transcriptional regulator [Natronorubrum sp. FCH18a]|uniref:MarR family transcriptional regulator n=1 Tax=Natronorubrum sp. FCH18a TaxID=3447018 RepID=UPI003F517B3A
MPDELASAQAKLVYLALHIAEEATATDLQQLVGLSKLTLFAVLETLVTKDLVQQTEDGYAIQ